MASECLQIQQILVSKLHQIQIKAVNHALQNLSNGDSNAASEPVKVIEFIKRWVAKEKTLVTNCIKQISTLGSEIVSNQTSIEHGITSPAIVEESLDAGKMARNLAAKKNKQRLEARVLKSRRVGEPEQLNVKHSPKIVISKPHKQALPPQMAPSSTNFNKNHSSSLIQIKI